MSKRAIFLASTAAGLALFGSIGFMQSNSSAFTSTPRVDLDSYLYSEVRAPSVPQGPAARPPTEPADLVFPALNIVAKPPRTRPIGESVSPVVPAHVPSIPCSPWREIGPRNVTDGKPIGSLQVRDLC